MRVLPMVALLMLTSSAFADDPGLTLTQSQNPNALYRLFGTKNTFNLLLLNTKDGSLRRIQWSGTPANTFNVALPQCSGADVPDSHPGRYTLQPTTNIWTFIMLDQDTGKSWYVQWSLNGDNDFCLPVPLTMTIRDFMGTPSTPPKQ
jgi:hypothetical protein